MLGLLAVHTGTLLPARIYLLCWLVLAGVLVLASARTGIVVSFKGVTIDIDYPCNFSHTGCTLAHLSVYAESVAVHSPRVHNPPSQAGLTLMFYADGAKESSLMPLLMPLQELGKTPGLVASFSPCPKTKESTLSEFSPQSVVRNLRTTNCKCTVVYLCISSILSTHYSLMQIS